MIQFSECSVRGIAAAVPRTIIDNRVYHTKIPQDEVMKRVHLTGINQYRRATPDVCASDLCFHAAINLFNTLDVDPATIDAIIYVTQTPDYRLPATACLLQSRLNCKQNIVAFDINMGCSGFIVGLFNSCTFLSGTHFKRVLLLCGDTQTKLVADDDTNVNFIMGDAGTAILIEKRQDAAPIYMTLNTDGSRFDKLIIPAGGFRLPSSEATREITKQSDGQYRSLEHMYMSGMDVFNFSVTDVATSIKEFMKERELSVETLSYLVLHQANKFMTDKIASKLGFKPEQVLYSMGEYGNTSCASIPLTIAHHMSLFSKKRQSCLLSGFGVGLSWGVVNLVFDNLICPAIVEV